MHMRRKPGIVHTISIDNDGELLLNSPRDAIKDSLNRDPFFCSRGIRIDRVQNGECNPRHFTSF